MLVIIINSGRNLRLEETERLSRLKESEKASFELSMALKEVGIDSHPLSSQLAMDTRRGSNFESFAELLDEINNHLVLEEHKRLLTRVKTPFVNR